MPPLNSSRYATLADARGGTPRPRASARTVPVVAIVGRINRWKGHDAFLRIAKRVSERRPGTLRDRRRADLPRRRLSPANCNRSSTNFGCAIRTTFVPWLDDVRKIYAATDVNVNCSLREPFGRAVTEAAACGVPTVCFDDSGAAETVIDGVSGRKVAAGDETAFADAILDYLTRSGRVWPRRKTPRVSRRSRFAAPRIAEQMAEVIRRAAQSAA